VFYIQISNGLLKDEHRSRMGSSVWEFMWLLDKVTRVDKDGTGWVLGGKPIKLKELVMGLDEETVSRNLIKLEKEGYIKKIRTPYGISIRVFKARKIFNQRINKNVESIRNHKNVESRRENVESNKTRQYDKTEDIVADATREVFSFKEKLKQMRESDRKYLKIISVYWSKKKIVLENEKQYQATLKRELRPAKALEGYSGRQIGEAITYCDNNYKIWTLETLGKRINDLISQNNENN